VAATVTGYGVVRGRAVVKSILAGMSFARPDRQALGGRLVRRAHFWRFTYLAEFDVIDDRTVGSVAKRDQYAAYAEVNFLAFEWLNLRGTFDFVKVSHAQDQTRYAIGAEPFIDRFSSRGSSTASTTVRPCPARSRTSSIENQAELVLELHFFF
jgi:hypothetical protein